MMDGNKQAPPAMSRYHEIELDKLFAGLESALTSRVQIGAAFATINLTAVGIAVSARLASVLILAGIFLLLLIFVDFIFLNVMLLNYYRIWQLRETYSPDDDGTYMEVWLPKTVRESDFGEIAGESDFSKRKKGLQGLAWKTQVRTVYSLWLPLALGLLEILLGLALLWLATDWTLS